MPKSMIRRVRTDNGSTIVKQGEGGVDKLRCPRCKSVAVRIQTKDGVVYQCGSCKTKFKSIVMG